MLFFVEVSEASDRKCPQSSEAPPEPQLYALVVFRFILWCYAVYQDLRICLEWS